MGGGVFGVHGSGTGEGSSAEVKGANEDGRADGAWLQEGNGSGSGPLRAKLEWQLINERVEGDHAEAKRRMDGLRLRLAPDTLPLALLDKGFLRSCMRAKKQDPDKAATLVKGYEGFRQKTGWLPGTISAANLRQELRTSFNMLLPYPDCYGHTVVTQTMGLLDLSLHETSMERYQQVGYYLMHRALQDPQSQLNGSDAGGTQTTPTTHVCIVS